MGLGWFNVKEVKVAGDGPHGKITFTTEVARRQLETMFKLSEEKNFDYMPEVLQAVIPLIAERYVKENFSEIAAKINQEALATMVSAAVASRFSLQVLR
jgi:hypothetical protein